MTTIIKSNINRIEDLSSETSIRLATNDSIYAVYDITGIQNEFTFFDNPTGGTVRVYGETGDIFEVQTKISNDFESELLSYDGKIMSAPFASKGIAMRLNVIANVSGAIKMEVKL